MEAGSTAPQRCPDQSASWIRRRIRCYSRREVSGRRCPGISRVEVPAGGGLRGNRGLQCCDTRQDGVGERHGVSHLHRLMGDVTDGAALRIVASTCVGVARPGYRASHQRDRQDHGKHTPHHVPSQRVGTSHGRQIDFLITRVPVRTQPPDKCLGHTREDTVTSAASPK
jgi:hypothetical protein